MAVVRLSRFISGEVIGPGLLGKILNDTEFTDEDLLKILAKHI